ncbi:MAG: hypothetical protein O3A10_13320 [Chloroflexi bacterium]|nr:hypothetical protein [Chloroflexota bacterium]MDA1147659.1 hypothetical protein [Chloroflexota bacterium]
MTANSRTGPLIAGVASALVMLFGSSLPWLTVGPASASLSTGNSDATVLCALAIGVTFAWWGLTRNGTGPLIATLPIAALALLVIVVDGSSSSVLLPDGNPAVSQSAAAGPGIYITGIGAAASIVAAAYGLTVDFRAWWRRSKEEHRQAHGSR